MAGWANMSTIWHAQKSCVEMKYPWNYVYKYIYINIRSLVMSSCFSLRTIPKPVFFPQLQPRPMVILSKPMESPSPGVVDLAINLPADPWRESREGSKGSRWGMPSASLQQAQEGIKRNYPKCPPSIFRVKCENFLIYIYICWFISPFFSQKICQVLII